MKKYFLITHGCQMNKSDSEKIASLLNKKYLRIQNEDKADIIVINVCSVKQSAVNRVYARINRHYQKKKIILAGCVLESDKKKLKDKVSEFWHPDSYFDKKPIIEDKKTALMPIMTGCNNFCTYCVVPYTRNREKSKKTEKIISEIKSLVNKNYQEIILLGQNVNSFKDNKTSFAKLLLKISKIKGDFIIGFLTLHPKDMTDELIEIIAQNPKIKKEIHLPVQSGDNEILKKMNRGYTVEQYKEIIKKIKKTMPSALLSTDIIVGFPQETKKQFENTKKLLKEINFYKAYISRYSPRPNTYAFKLKDNVSIEEKKKRWEILEKIVNKK